MFYDTASTTLLASTVYRAALLVNDHSHLPNAEKCRQALYAAGSSGSSESSSPSSSSQSTSQSSASASSSKASSSASQGSSSVPSSGSSSATSATAPAASASATTAPLTGLVHFTSDGWLTPVVNPHQFGVEGQDSPEGEAFVLEFQAAYNEWVAGGSVGANAARRTAASAAGWAWMVACAVFGTFVAVA